MYVLQGVKFCLKVKVLCLKFLNNGIMFSRFSGGFSFSSEQNLFQQKACLIDALAASGSWMFVLVWTKSLPTDGLLCCILANFFWVFNVYTSLNKISSNRWLWLGLTLIMSQIHIPERTVLQFINWILYWTHLVLLQIGLQSIGLQIFLYIYIVSFKRLEKPPWFDKQCRTE